MDKYVHRTSFRTKNNEKVRWQSYIETAKNKKVLEKLHHEIVHSFVQHSLRGQNLRDYFGEIETFSKVNIGIIGKISYLLTGSPIDYDVISSTRVKYSAEERCILLAKEFEEKYKDFPLILECSYSGYNLKTFDEDVKLTTRINPKEL